ncbi:MAG: AAA family ATPase [Actinomycetota bacterium]|nr:AAA family ATPase [Actinomycetota bacterium]
MLLLLTGTSASGKTTLARRLPPMPDLEVHDFDEIGVPEVFPPHWRNRANEDWLQRALTLQHQGKDLLLTGQTPLGEALATPSAERLTGLSVCLIDCSDEDRIARLHLRDGGMDPNLVSAMVTWADWMRLHHQDPQYEQHVIVDGSWPQMRWDRWTSWTRDDPRWRAEVINTSTFDLDGATTRLAEWITIQRGHLDR